MAAAKDDEPQNAVDVARTSPADYDEYIPQENQ